MSITDELRKLQELHRDGGLTDAEFSAAKAKILAGTDSSPRSDQPLSPDYLEEMRRQNELQTIDRQWDVERENYMMTGKHGHRYIPQRGTSVIGGVVVVVFGVLWTAFSASIISSHPGPGFASLFPLFGVVFIVFGVVVSIVSYKKAEEYERAKDAYRRRRASGAESDQEFLDNFGDHSDGESRNR